MERHRATPARGSGVRSAGTAGFPQRSRPMLYAGVAAAVLSMVSFMFWRAGGGMRRDRILNARAATRGRHGMGRRQRARMLLGRAYAPTDEAEWQQPLTRALDEVAKGEPRP